jgi:predicted Zn-dependent protease
MTTHFRPLLPALLGWLFLSGCAVSTSPVTGQRRAYAYSWADEVKMGREADAEIVQEMGLYEDPALTAYVARVGEEVLAKSHMRRPDALPEYRATPFTFRVLDSPIVNAFALPGGYVYVTRGLLAHVENEAQLAVVLGHEVAHVAARHTSQSMLEQGLAMVGLMGASLLAEELYELGDEVAGVGGAAMQLFMLRYDRGDEEESDRLGVEYSSQAGFRAGEGAGFFELLKRMQDDEEDGWIPGFLSTHPDPGKREQTVARLAAEWAHKGPPPTRMGEDEFLDALDGMVLGEDPRDGFVEEGGYFHPGLRFRFTVPAGWEVEHEQGRVQMADEDAEASGILFGEVREQTSAREAAAEFVEENELAVLREAGDTRKGIPGWRVEARQVDGDDTTRVTARFLEHGGKVFMFAGLGSPTEFAEREDTFERVLGSFARLTDPRALSVQPTRLRVVRAQAGAPFRSLVAGGPRPRDMDEEDMALLNHLRLEDVVPAGRRLKLAQ